MRFVEELMVLLIDREKGNLVPVPDLSLRAAFAGATLMDLALEERIDTDLKSLVLVDPTPIGDELVDPALEAIAAAPDPKDTAHWIEHFAQPAIAYRLRDKALGRLVDRRIFEGGEDNWLLNSVVTRTRRYPMADGKADQEVDLRVMGILFANDVPSPRDAMLISLLHVCGLFSRLLSPQEQDEVRDRIELVSHLDLIGRAVLEVIRSEEASDSDAPGTDDAAPSERERRAGALARQPLADGGGLPLVGNLFRLAKGDLPAFLAEQYRKLGPVFRIRAPFHSYTVMVGPEANLFQQRQGRLYLRSLKAFGPLVESMGAHRLMVSMDGGDHFRWRKEMGRGFSHNIILDKLDTAAHIADRAIDEWPEREPFSVLPAVRRIVIEQISELCANTAATEYVDDLTHYFDAILATRITHARPSVLLRMPRFRRSRARVERLAETVLHAHGGECPVGRKPDFIDDIVRLHSTDPQLLPERDLFPSCLAPFLAGIHTVTSSAAFMFHELLKHPEVRAPMVQEADELFAGTGPTPEKLSRMDVTPRAVKETLRLYPVAPIAPREAVNTFEFADHTIPCGTNVLLATTVPHMCHEHFPNPDRFDIDRYLPGREEHMAPGVFAPFGLGTHRCLGNRFAEVQLAIIAATLLHRVDVELHPSNFKLRPRYAPLLSPGDAFKVRIVQKRQ